MKRATLVAALLVALVSSSVSAQVDRATLTGVITDGNGAVLPGATITVTNLATNVVSPQPTSETGAYLIVNLIPGKYRIDVEMNGFKKAPRS